VLETSVWVKYDKIVIENLKKMKTSVMTLGRRFMENKYIGSFNGFSVPVAQLQNVFRFFLLPLKFLTFCSFYYNVTAPVSGGYNDFTVTPCTV